MKERVTVAVSVLLQLAACSNDPDHGSSANTAATSASPVAAAPPATPNKVVNPCPHTGRWELCHVEKRLRQSGFVARRDSSGALERPGFSVKPAVYTIGRSRLEIFLYDTEADAARDLARLDTITATLPGVPSPWPAAPQLIRSGNVAAVFMTQNARQLERLVLAITAGAPQPGSPR